MQAHCLLFLISTAAISACFFDPPATVLQEETETSTDSTAEGPTDSGDETNTLDTTGAASGTTDDPTETGPCPAAIFGQSAFGGACFG